MSSRRAFAGKLLASVALVACGPRASGGKPRDEPRVVAARDRDAAAPVETPALGPPRQVVIDMTDPTSECVLGYRGPVIDLSSKDEAARLGSRFRPPAVDWIEREGSSWAEVRGKSLAVDFFVVVPADVTAEGPAGATPFLEARVRGGAARTLSFYLNGHPLGAAALPRGETRVVALKGAAAEPVPGANELTIRFSGMGKGGSGGNDPSAELEWVHFGVGEPDPLYAAPTRRDATVSRSFGGKPVRALSLRGPGSARCEGWLPSGSSVEATVTLEGAGAADAEVRVIRDRVPPTVIGTLHLDSADPPSARVHSWPIGDAFVPGTLGAVELSVVRASRSARVIFGEPRVLGPPAPTPAVTPPPRPASRGVVLVVLSQVGGHALGAYGGTLATPNIAALAASGVVFDANRASSAVAGAAMGAMLTGLPVLELGLLDGDSRLPRGVTTLAEAVRPAGIATAFFTANPLTSSAFAFDRGWSHFEAHGPTDDGPSTRVYDAAIAWLAEHTHEREPFLVVIHARGGHPPWDVPLERAKSLPPENYGGGLDPRHAAELLGRAFRTPGSYRFDDADRARAGALYGVAMEAEDAAVGRLVSALKTDGVDESTTIIVTSDVGVNEAARVPFAETESLDEAALATPLVIRWAHDAARHGHVGAVSSEEDIATTVLSAFGLAAPVSFKGQDLGALADSTSTASTSRPLIAADQDRFALRWGSFVSSGVRDHETKLCDLSLEPACVADVRESYPLASRLLHGVLFDKLVEVRATIPREPASIDAATLAALKLWGR